VWAFVTDWAKNRVLNHFNMSSPRHARFLDAVHASMGLGQAHRRTATAMQHDHVHERLN
jgi:hypothetical protein